MASTDVRTPFPAEDPQLTTLVLRWHLMVRTLWRVASPRWLMVDSSTWQDSPEIKPIHTPGLQWEKLILVHSLQYLEDKAITLKTGF